MQFSVRFFTILREVTDKKEVTMQFAEAKKVTLNAVLKALSNCYGKPFAEYVYDLQTGQVKGFLQFFINGQSTTTLKGLDSEIQNGDVLAIVPPVGGG